MVRKILSHKNFIYFLLAGAFILRIILFLTINKSNYNFGDAAHYVQTAKNIADGKGFTIFNSDEVAVNFNKGFKSLVSTKSNIDPPTEDLYYYGLAPYGEPFIFWDPLLPHLLAVFYALGDEGLIVFNLFGCLIGTLSCFLVYKLGEILLNRSAGLVAAFIMMFEFNSVYYSSLIMTENISIFLLLLVLICMYKAFQKPEVLTLIIIGFLVGLSYLLRANLLLLLPVCLFFVYRRLEKSIKIRIMYILLGFIIAGAPWWSRNYAKTGHMGFMPSKGVFNIWKTNVSLGAIADQMGISLRFDSEDQIKRVEDSVKYPEAMYISTIQGSDEHERSENLRKMCRDFINTNFSLVAKMYLTNIVTFFNPIPLFGNIVQKLYLAMIFLFITVTGIYGLYRAYRVGIYISPLIMYIILFAASTGFFRIGFRFRMPIMPIFMLMSGYAIYLFINRKNETLDT